MGTVRGVEDNALARELLRHSGVQLLDRNKFRTYTEAKMTIFGFTESWYNSTAVYSGPDFSSPMSYERKCMAEAQIRKPLTVHGRGQIHCAHRHPSFDLIFSGRLVQEVC